MNIIIKKFGGTSVSSLERIERASHYIQKARSLGYQVVVVVSAMGKETDRLLNLIPGLSEYKDTDDLSSLLSSNKFSSLFSIILNKNNIKSKSFQACNFQL